MKWLPGLQYLKDMKLKFSIKLSMILFPFISSMEVYWTFASIFNVFLSSKTYNISYTKAFNITVSCSENVQNCKILTFVENV